MRKNRREFEIIYKLLDTINGHQYHISELSIYINISYIQLKQRIDHLLDLKYLIKVPTKRSHNRGIRRKDNQFYYMLTHEGLQFKKAIEDFSCS